MTPGRLGNLVHPRVVGVKCERDERLEPAGLVLKLAKPHEVVNAVLGLVDVAVEHRGVRVQAETVGRPVDVEPDIGRRLRATDPFADLRMKNLRATARKATQAGVDQSLEDRLDRLPGDPREELDLHGRVGLDVDLGIGVVNPLHDIDVILERELVV